jgi:hypothetical protein
MTVKVSFSETRFVSLVGPHGELEMEKEVIFDVAEEATERREKKRRERIGKGGRRREGGGGEDMVIVRLWYGEVLVV